MKSKPKKTEKPKEQRWTYSAYRATLRECGEFFALVTPDGKNALKPKQARWLLDALNGRKELMEALEEITDEAAIAAFRKSSNVFLRLVGVKPIMRAALAKEKAEADNTQ